MFNQLQQYGSWLNAQDPDTLHLYFGGTMGTQSIDQLIQRINSSPQNNHILIAKINDIWVGTIHIATRDKDVEFGIIVSTQFRKQGIANILMDEAITWARNRRFQNLYMHYISRNHPIKRLCRKFGLMPHNMIGDSEAKLKLDSPSCITFFKELLFSQRNWAVNTTAPVLVFLEKSITNHYAYNVNTLTQSL